MLSKEYKNTRELLEALMEGGEAVKRENPRGNETSYFFMVPKTQSPTGEEVINVPDGVDPQAFKAAGYKVPERVSFPTNMESGGLSSLNKPSLGESSPTTLGNGLNNANGFPFSWGNSTSGYGNTIRSGLDSTNSGGNLDTGYGNTLNTANGGLDTRLNGGTENGQNSLYIDNLSQSRLFGSSLGSPSDDKQKLNLGLYNTYLSPRIQLSNGVLVADNSNKVYSPQKYENSRGYHYWNTPARTQDEFLDRVLSNLEKSEDNLTYLYSDSKGNVTVGPGLKIPNRRALDNYDFYRKEEVNNPNAVPVGAAEKDALWNKITQYIQERCGSLPLKPGEKCKVPVGGLQEDLFGHLQIRQEDARTMGHDFLINNTLGPVKQSVKNAGFNWDDFSYPAQELFINGFYNEGKTPNSIKGGVDAIRRNDWNYICNAYINADIDHERAKHYNQLCNQQSQNPVPPYKGQ